MTTKPSSPAVSKMPDITAPMACIGLTACERALALGMNTLKLAMIGNVQDCEDATWQGASASPARPFGSWLQAGPMLLYGAEMLRIYQTAIGEMADLLTAQSHGEQQEVNVLIDRIRSQAARAHQPASEATRH